MGFWRIIRRRYFYVFHLYMLIFPVFGSLSILIPIRIANNATSARADSSDILNVLSLIFPRRKKFEVGVSES